MIIDDFNIIGVTVFPSEANSPLLVDSYTVFAFAITRESFQFI
jgi:hypothetical protein